MAKWQSNDHFQEFFKSGGETKWGGQYEREKDGYGFCFYLKPAEGEEKPVLRIIISADGNMLSILPQKETTKKPGNFQDVSYSPDYKFCNGSANLQSFINILIAQKNLHSLTDLWLEMADAPFQFSTQKVRKSFNIGESTITEEIVSSGEDIPNEEQTNTTEAQNLEDSTDSDNTEDRQGLEDNSDSTTNNREEGEEE